MIKAYLGVQGHGPFQKPRQSLAFHLAMQELAALIAKRGAVSSGERSEAAAADTAQASTLPDGNHGENISGVPNHD